MSEKVEIQSISKIVYEDTTTTNGLVLRRYSWGEWYLLDEDIHNDITKSDKEFYEELYREYKEKNTERNQHAKQKNQ
jgi:hypothetical protein